MQKWSFELGGLSWDPKAEQVEPEDKWGLVGCAGKCDLFPKCLPSLGRCFPELGAGAVGILGEMLAVW